MIDRRAILLESTTERFKTAKAGYDRISRGLMKKEKICCLKQDDRPHACPEERKL